MDGEGEQVNNQLEEEKQHDQERMGQEREKPSEQSDENKSDHSDDDSDEKYLINCLLDMGISMQKPEIPEGTGFIYDEKMAEHRNLWDTNYPECPERVTEPFKRCCELGLVERCTRIEAQHGTEDQVLLQHSEALLDILKSTTLMDTEQLKQLSAKYDSIYLHQSSYQCALLALGSTIELMEQILKKKIRNGMALIRPPGHHAEHDEFCGFSYFNQVAIAAKHAVDHLGLKRVLIVDWDVHHGQATQNMFYDDPRILYFSIHRYEYGKFWPHLRESDYDFIGSGEGKGFNINVPLNKTKMTDSDYLAIFQQILMPVAYQFDPELVLVSAGYDAAVGCPEFSAELVIVSAGFDSALGDYKGEMSLTPVAFAHFTHQLMSLAEGRVCVCLEGGYCLKSLSESVALTLRTLLGDPCPVLPHVQEPSDRWPVLNGGGKSEYQEITTDLQLETIDSLRIDLSIPQSVATSILNVIKVLKPYWSCLQYQTDLDEEELCSFDDVNNMPPRPDIDFMTKENRPKTFPIVYEYPAEVEEEYRIRHKYDVTIATLIAETSLATAPHKVCVAYDEAMKAHRAVSFLGHPECPDRISSIFEKHVQWGLIDRCHRVRSRLATPVELQTVHSSSHIEEMQSIPEKSASELLQTQHKYNSIYMCQETNMCAMMGSGCVLNVTEKVLSGQTQSGIAIVRPPGHHAEYTKPMGFCFFNNVAIAVKYAQQNYGLKRILILDWDVHHGNGTQHCFYEDPSVLFISLHRYDDGRFYPSSPDGDSDTVGTDKGEGYNINIPWNYGPMGDAEYIAAFQQIVMPIAYEFSPELVLVSAGFDAAMGDPLGGYQITPAGYGHMTHMLSSLANGRVILILEGGYNLAAISHSMATCTSVLLGDCCPHLPYSQPKESAVVCIEEVLETQKQYWKSLKFRVSIPSLKAAQKCEKDSGAGQTKNSNPPTGKTVSSGGDNSVEIITDQLRNVSVDSKDNKDVPDKTVDSSGSPPEGAGGNSNEPQAGSSAAVGGAVGGARKPPGQSNEVANTIVQDLDNKGVQQMFAVEPRPWCPHLDTVNPLPSGGLDTAAPCQTCGDTSENWVCLVCYQVYCSRFVNEDMVIHGATEQHLMTLSFSDLSVWCYGCDDYIDNQVLVPAKRAAHLHKFGTDMVQAH